MRIEQICHHAFTFEMCECIQKPKLQGIFHNTSDRTPWFRTGQWLMPCSIYSFSLWYEPAVACVLQPMSVQVPGDRKTTHSQIMRTRSASWAEDVTLILSRISTCCPDAGEFKSSHTRGASCGKRKSNAQPCWERSESIGFVRFIEHEQKF